MSDRDIAWDLAEHATARQFPELADSTVQATVDALYDTLAVALGGLNAPGLPEARRAFAPWGSGGVSLWGGFGTAPGPMAALLNAAALHALDYDDTDDSVPLHANSVVLPALLADVQESKPDCRGHEFLTALAVGIDGSMRIGRAGGPRGSRGWNYSVISGGIGAVLAIARLRRWNAETTVSALGHQLAQTAGSLQSIIDGSLAKRFQPAMVAKDVLFGARLAEAGITGPQNVFEGRAGFFALYQDNDFDRDRLVEGIETAALVDDLSLKPYPACRFTHASIDLALAMRQAGVDPAEVDELRYRVSGQAVNMVGRAYDHTKANVVDAQFSIAYTAAVALHRGAVRIEDFDTARIADPTIGEFAGTRVRIEATDSVEFLAMAPVAATVVARDGSTREFLTETVSGSPEHRLSQEQLLAKAEDCLRHGNSPISPRELWDAVAALADDQPVGHLVDLLCRSDSDR